MISLEGAGPAEGRAAFSVLPTSSPTETM